MFSEAAVMSERNGLYIRYKSLSIYWLYHL